MSGGTKITGLTVEIYGDDKEFQDTVAGTKEALKQLGAGISAFAFF